MARFSVKEFLQRVQRSRLVPREQLKKSLLELKRKSDGRLPSDVLVVAKHLVRSKVVTRWQCEKLLAGKSRGFFLGDFKLLDHICTGGMSSVYLALDVQTKALRAVKVFPKSRLEHPSYLKRFHLEAEATISLDHENVVRAYGLENQDDNYYLVMDYVRGRDLLVTVNEDGRLDPRVAADYIAQAAKGLQFAHDRGLIHRDVKPANLLVDKEGVIKVLDLGLALYQDETDSLTIANDENVLGTADYLAPEQALDSHHVDGRADIYGLGCTLYFALTGHAPFPEGTIAQRILKHQNETPTPISAERDDCPKELEQLCFQMMQKDAAERPQSCEEVERVLRTWIETGRTLRSRVPAGVGSGGDDRVLPADDSDSRLFRRGKMFRRPRTPDHRTNDTLASSDAETIVSRKRTAEIRSQPAANPSPSPRHPVLWLAAGALIAFALSAVFVLAVSYLS